MSRRKNKKYSAELKLEAVQAYLNGEGSYEKLRKRYGLLSSTQLKEWRRWQFTDYLQKTRDQRQKAAAEPDKVV